MSLSRQASSAINGILGHLSGYGHSLKRHGALNMINVRFPQLISFLDFLPVPRY